MRNYKLNEMKLSKHLKVRACLYKTAKIGLVSLMIVGTNLSPILTLAEETQSVVQTDNSEASASIIEAPSVATVSEEPTPLSPDNQESAVSPIETPSAPVISKAPALSTKMDEHLTDVSSVPETAPTALNDEAMVTVTSQTGENFVVRASHIEEDVKNQLVERYDLFLTQMYIDWGWPSDVRELIDVYISAAPDAANAGQIYIWLQDNNGVNNFAYHIDSEIYYTGHSLGGCDYVDTSQIPLDKYQTGDIIDPSDYDASSRFGNLTGDMFNGSGVLPAGVELEPEMYAIADFHGNFMKTPYYGFGNSVHIFPGFRVKKETIIPLPPINLHFLIDNTEVWSETTLTEWAALSPTLDEDQEVWDYLRTQNPSATTIDPFLNYGQWTLDFDYKPGTFEVSDVYLKMTTTEKSAEVTIKHDYAGTVLDAYNMTTTLRNAPTVLDAAIPQYAQDLGLVATPDSTDAYQTVTGWEVSSTEKVINGDQYEFIYHFKPKMTAHKVEKAVIHIYHNYDDYSVVATSGVRNDPTDGVKAPLGMVLDFWKIDNDVLISSEINRDNLTTREVREVHYTPVFKQTFLPTTGNFTTQLEQPINSEQATTAVPQPKLPNTGERNEKLLTSLAIAVTSAVSSLYLIQRKQSKVKG